MGAVRAVQNRQENIIPGVIAHHLFYVPPGGNAHIALRAFRDQLRVCLAEHLRIHQSFRIPVMEVGDRLPVSIRHTDKINGAVVAQYQILADVVWPVGEPEARIKDILSPAPLVETGTHWNGAARRVSVIFRTHVIVLEGFECRVQFLQRRGHRKSQFIQPCLVDHGKLRHGIDAVILRRADPRRSHTLS